METELSLLENNSLNIQNNLEKEQTSFLQSGLGEVINNALDIGLKAILPDMIEDQVIEVKDTILESGFKEGMSKALENAIDFGKSAIGIVTGNFENINQIETAIKKGGIIDTVSELLDASVEKAQKNDLIDKSIANLIKKGKNTILNSVSDKIEDTLETQVKNIEKLDNYSNKWKEAYEAQDFDTMSKNFKNIEKYLKQTIPLENTINRAREIENLHNLIKNNGENFNICEEELKLAQKLVN